MSKTGNFASQQPLKIGSPTYAGEPFSTFIETLNLN